MLIDEDRDGGSRFFRGGASRLEQRLEVVLEVAVVREPGFGGEVEADLDIVVLDLQSLREPCEPSQRTGCEYLGLGVSRQTQQRLPKLLCQDRRERAVLGRLDSQRLDTCGLGVVPHSIQQDRLADASESNHENALGRRPPAHSCDRDSHLLSQLIAAGELGRLRSCSGREAVRDGTRIRSVPIFGTSSATGDLGSGSV